MDRVTDSGVKTQLDLEGLPRHVTLTDTSLTCQILVSDTVIVIDTTSVTGDSKAIATLPSIAEAVGNLYYISAPEGATGGDLSLHEKETGQELATYGDMDADDEYNILFCTGIGWVAVKSSVA